MEYTALADPFNIQFEKDRIQYKAKVVYAKSLNSCANFFLVQIEWPTGIAPFSLKEKVVHRPESETMIWVDDRGRESGFYEIIGNEIVSHMKTKLGVFLLDTSVADKDESQVF